MKHTLLLFATALLLGIQSYAQNVAINNDGSEPDSSAALDVKASDKGVLIPRVDFNNLPISPPTGLLVYVTANGPDGDNAFYFFDGTQWKMIEGGLTETDPVFGSSAASGITGSDITNWNNKVSSQWTTTGSNIYFNSGNVGIGHSSPKAPLEFANIVGNRKIVFYSTADNDHQFTGIGLNYDALRFQMGNAAGNFKFYVATSANSSTELFRIEGDGDIVAQGQIKNVNDPTDAQDAATKAYVDEVISLLEANGLVVVDFTVDDTSVFIGNSIQFTNASLLATTTWLWDFGDGITSTEENPVHGYATEGEYTVSLTAGNGILNSTKTKVNFITVTDIFGSFTDSRDGTVYQTIVIGEQVWMAENLKYLPAVSGPGAGSNTSFYYYVYDYNGTNVTEAKATANFNTYGVLYNWPAALNGDPPSGSNPSGVQGICPNGWHLPSDTEWAQLRTYCGGENEAGGKLKETGFSHWTYPNTGATDEYYFTALPGGGRFSVGSFNSIHDSGYWWSSGQYSSSGGWFFRILYNYSTGTNYFGEKQCAYSVRCVQD